MGSILSGIPESLKCFKLLREVANCCQSPGWVFFVLFFSFSLTVLKTGSRAQGTVGLLAFSRPWVQRDTVRVYLSSKLCVSIGLMTYCHQSDQGTRGTSVRILVSYVLLTTSLLGFQEKNLKW